uniref:Uncharacterized protein n=1 Tax=Globisporangium ultimum (strain ATCC 200006 / CBS 805.95 / DAOM BR144) TaxID=431595 RepID=K3W8M8_GLOUD
MVFGRLGAVAAHRALQQTRCVSSFAPLYATSAVQCSVGSASVAVASRWSHQQQQSGSEHIRRGVFNAAFAIVTAAVGVGTVASATAPSHCEESTTAVEGGYSVNPIQNVTALLRLYDEIDKNMEVLTNRMLEDLSKRVEQEKKENNGELKLSPEQLALQMSIEFESTLEKVQDAVFRNNYVSKEQVTQAMQQLINGELRGGAKDGKITPAEADAISEYVRRLGRMRWKVTGSRQPLIPTHQKRLVKEEKPKIELPVVIQVMEELIPSLTHEMEAIAKSLEQRGISETERRAQISKDYIRRSGELTEQICAKYQLDLREFQQALVFYHDDDDFEQALARLSTEQQQKFAELGL